MIPSFATLVRGDRLPLRARVAKLADAPDLGSGGAILRGSSPLPGSLFRFVKNQHLEIERKFLLRRLPRDLAKYKHNKIEQGYLAIGRDRSHVRVRRKGRAHTLTFKRGSATGREEREIRLTRAQFDVLWPATAGARLTKTRYDVPWKKSIIEIDIYHGSNEGLIVAEVEFPDEKSCRNFEMPDWLGADVTSVGRYSNPRLARD